MNLKLVSVSLLALAVASTMVLAGCKPKEEAVDVNVTTEEGAPAVVEEEVAPVEEGAATETDVNVETEEAAHEEPAAEEATHH